MRRKIALFFASGKNRPHRLQAIFFSATEALYCPGTSPPCGPKSPWNEPRLRPYIALEQGPLPALYRPRTSPPCGLISPSNRPLISPSNKARLRPYIAGRRAARGLGGGSLEPNFVDLGFALNICILIVN